MIQSCYDFPSRLTRDPATQYCWNRVLGPMFYCESFGRILQAAV